MRAVVTFTDRGGGVSAPPYDTFNLADHVGDDPDRVAENRRRLGHRLGVERLVFMHQVHGGQVGVVDGTVAGPVAGVDALVTTTPGAALVVLVADCVPVLLTAPGAVAAVHAGRRGVVAGVVAAAVTRLRGLGAGPVTAHLGPSVCGRCYEVPPAMQAEVCAAAPAARSTTRRGTTGLDLAAAVRAQLTELGVREQRTAPPCTAEDAACFSHRRDGVTGRFAGVAVLATGDGP